MEITAEVKAAYKSSIRSRGEAKGPNHFDTLADFARDALAEGLKAEHEIKHPVWSGNQESCFQVRGPCTWDDEHWRQEAERRLGEP
jgi:hypothetical protein